MEPQELYGFLWHAFPYTQAAKDAQEPLAQPHWSDPPTPGTQPDGVILLEERDGWHQRFGHNGFLLLSERPEPSTVPAGWMCQDADLPDGWTGSDRRGEVEVLGRGGREESSPVSGVRHYVRVCRRQT